VIESEDENLIIITDDVQEDDEDEVVVGRNEPVEVTFEIDL
jgi:hypothetical protein